MNRVLVFCLGGLALAGCATTDLAPQPAADQLTSPEAVRRVTAVDVPVCSQREVNHPAKPGMNARLALKLTNHALSRANGRIRLLNRCSQQVRDGFGEGLTNR